ncbi:sensor histidine kinase [Gemmatimonadota bacterium]
MSPRTLSTLPPETEEAKGALEGGGSLDAFDRAVESVYLAWPEDSVYRTREDVRERLETISRAVRELESGGSCSDLSGARDLAVDRFLVGKLLEALSTEMLSQSPPAESGESPEEVLRTLRSLEMLRQDTLPEEARDFSTRFNDPDGFELLVEVAHDLRSPLTSITFLAETLKAGHSGEVNELQENQLGLIWSAAFGMTTVFSDIMDLAKERAGVAEEPPAPFSIRGVFEEVAQMVGPMVEVKGLEITFTPPLHEQVWGNEVALFRVLLNLTTNAIKFTEEGSVEVGAETLDRDLVEFSVRDTGRGINEEGRKTLFAPFKKAGHRGGFFFSGSGLGLAIARRHVRAMGSELLLETEHGWGTRFSFTLRLPPAGDH